MKLIPCTVLGAILLTASAGAEDANPTSPGAPQLAMRQPGLRPSPATGRAHLTVQSPAFADGGDIPYENTQYRGNVFPGLSWSGGPTGTRSYAIIMQDPDAIRDGMPILHWTMYNIPASVTRLEPGVAAAPPGASYGPNIRGAAQPYLGPHTPPGPKHHYHIQLFALDTVLPADSGASYAALTGAMQGHVLAGGELIGLAQADPTAAAPPPHSP